MPELIPVDHDPFADVGQGPLFNALNMGAGIQRDRFAAPLSPPVDTFADRFDAGGFSGSPPPDAFEAAASRTRQSVHPTGGRREGFGTMLAERYLPQVMHGIASLPQRAIEAAGELQRQGDVYNPAPAMETALMMVGTPGRPSGSLGSGAGPPIRAYHGSPHDFERFDMSKIGTGEGAQAYGHGLYFAENPKVAMDYRDQVKNMSLITDVNKRLSEIAREMEPLKKPGSFREFKDQRGYALADEYDRLMAEKMKPGRMYEVNINAHPDQFLDWEKPLIEQPHVERVLRDRLGVFGPSKSMVRPEDLGESVYRAVARESVPAAEQRGGFDAFSPFAASSALREVGIPGIKYLDQGSRLAPANTSLFEAHLADARKAGAGPEELAKLEARLAEEQAKNTGTSNYVLFRDDIIDILRKYGIAGIAALPPAMQSAVSDHLVPVDYDPFAQ